MCVCMYLHIYIYIYIYDIYIYICHLGLEVVLEECSALLACLIGTH